MKRFILGAIIVAAAVRPAAAQDRQAILVAEDARRTDDASMAPLLKGLQSRDPAIAIAAARGLGRFENRLFVGRLAAVLRDPRPAVRAAAIHALGQIGRDSTVTDSIAALLLPLADKPADPATQGAVARSLGRLPVRRAELQARVGQALARLLEKRDPLLLVDATRGMEAWLRLAGRASDPGAAVRARLVQLAHTQGADQANAARVRRAATAALARLVDPAVAGLRTDPDPEVRRLVALWAAQPAADGQAALEALLQDPAPMVRTEALRAWGQKALTARDCTPLLRALRDSAIVVALQAIDGLLPSCPGAVERLRPIVDTVADTYRGHVGTVASWHRGAHGLVTLARLNPNEARVVLSRAATSTIWQVRMYAARAAAIVGDADRLILLSEDASDNVREAAVEALLKVRGHAADSIFRVQLTRPGYQVVRAAAEALAGATDRPRTAAALEAALARISRDRRDTSRDPRMAILERLGEVGDPALAPRLEPYLADFDAAVAARAAALIGKWTGREVRPAPHPLEAPRLDWNTIARLKGARLRIEMARSSGGGAFEIELYPELAPATVARIAEHARKGYYDGLTFHRFVANFVIQGGSPGANEFIGDVLYLRDETGPVSHERGTMGISTRGRDTGDAQFFVNLVENLRLDFDYTVWGRIVAGQGVAEGVLEGDVMERVSVVDGGAPGRQR